MMPGMPNLQSILQQAQQMQADMAQAQADLAMAEVTGHSGGGLVSATLSGDGQLKALVIDPSVVDPTDVETLADLVIAAVRDAGRAAADLAEQTMGTVAGGMPGPGAFDLPGGFDLSAFGLPVIEGLADDLDGDDLDGDDLDDDDLDDDDLDDDDDDDDDDGDDDDDDELDDDVVDGSGPAVDDGDQHTPRVVPPGV